MTAPDTTLRMLTGYRLQRATGIAMLRYKAVFAQFGLRRTTFSCLSLIVETPGLRQSQLGETLAIERPNLVNIIEDLRKQNLIRKVVSKADRRAFSLYTTDAGRARFSEANTAIRALDEQITSGFTKPEIAAFHQALDRLEQNAKALTEETRAKETGPRQC